MLNLGLILLIGDTIVYAYLYLTGAEPSGWVLIPAMVGEALIVNSIFTRRSKIGEMNKHKT